jgi:transposase
MPVRLSKEEVVTIQVLAKRGQNQCEIARTVGVTESTVRYHVRRAREGAEDGRKEKAFAAERYGAVISAWHAEGRGSRRPINVMELYEHLVAEHGYEATYRSVLRYVRSRYPRPRVRTYRRVETPPGAQTQTDWAEFGSVDLGRGPQRVSALVMKLSHSRKPAVVWSERKDLLSWLSCHNGGFRRLGGVAATNRIDNVKTAIVQGAGPTGVIHPAYRAYARSLGFHIDACNAGDPEAKGKAEAGVRLARLLGDPARRPWEGLEELQRVTDARLERHCRRALCPATGLTVEASWQRELARLRPLPALLPEPFDIAVTRPVHKDCTVRFEQRSYTVPFAWVGQRVEVRGCAGTVQILAEGRVIQHYPRQTAERLLIDPSCYEGEATERVDPPRPLGRMGARLQAIYELPVEQRPVDLYAALAEVAR